MIYTKQTDGTLVAAADIAKESVADKLIDAIKAPLLKENEVMDASGVFYTALAWGGVGAVGGGMVARKRAEAGKPALLRVLF